MPPSQSRRLFALCLTLSIGYGCAETGADSDDDAGFVLPGAQDSGIRNDAGFPLYDGSVPRYDGSLPSYDGSLPGYDGSFPIGDSGLPSTDGGVPGDAGAASDAGLTDGGSITPPSDGGLIRGEAPTRAAGLKNGPYTIKSTTTGFRNGAAFADSTLWWPDNATPPFAYVGIVPGWVSSEGDIKEWGPFLASHGIVAMTSSTNSPITDLPADRANALLDILKSITEENTRSGSPLMGKLDTSRQGVMGWSMGGGGALLAAERTPSLKAAISMCGWNPDYNYGKVTVPSLMFAATPTDVLAGGQSQGFYTTLPSTTPKELFEINNAGHWEANTPKNQGGVVGLYGLSWLKVFLEGDARWRPFLKEKPTQAADFRNNL